jgi:hypothetical protein
MQEKEITSRQEARESMASLVHEYTPFSRTERSCENYSLLVFPRVLPKYLRTTCQPLPLNIATLGTKLPTHEHLVAKPYPNQCISSKQFFSLPVAMSCCNAIGQSFEACYSQ